MSDTALREHGEAIKAALPDAVLGFDIAYGELTMHIAPDHIVDALTWLRDDSGCQYTTLIDICGVDWPARTKRFDVVYHLSLPIFV